MSHERFLDELRSEVLTAAGRAQRVHTPDRARRARRRVHVLAAAAITALVAAFVLARPEPAAAGIRITREGDELVVMLVDVEARPSEIEAAAAEAGIDLRVEAAPVAPSLVGSFLGGTSSELPPVVRTIGGDPTSGFSGFRVPAGFDGSIRLVLGREAEPGEEWAHTADATRPGGVLECVEVVGRPLVDVLARIRTAGAPEARVMLLEEARWLEPDELDRHARATVLHVAARSDRTLWVEASHDPARFRRDPARSPRPDGADAC